MIFLHIPRKISFRYPLRHGDTHAIPSLLTGYPQIKNFSGDDVFRNRSVDSFLSRGESQKDGSIWSEKSRETGPPVPVSTG